MCGNEIEALRMVCVLGYGASGDTRAATCCDALVCKWLVCCPLFERCGSLRQRGECRLVNADSGDPDVVDPLAENCNGNDVPS
jgi:hypothetical protein